VVRVGLLDQLRQEPGLLVEDQRGDESAAAESVFPLRRDSLEFGVGVHGVALGERGRVLVAVMCFVFARWNIFRSFHEYSTTLS
jgi:hypothetical protein